MYREMHKISTSLYGGSMGLSAGLGATQDWNVPQDSAGTNRHY